MGSTAGELKPGDVVALRPGGAGCTPMVVLDVGVTGLVWCQWIAGGVVTQHGFPAGSLTAHVGDGVEAFEAENLARQSG